MPDDFAAHDAFTRKHHRRAGRDKGEPAGAGQGSLAIWLRFRAPRRVPPYARPFSARAPAPSRLGMFTGRVRRRIYFATRAGRAIRLSGAYGRHLPPVPPRRRSILGHRLPLITRASGRGDGLIIGRHDTPAAAVATYKRFIIGAHADARAR